MKAALHYRLQLQNMEEINFLEGKDGAAKKNQKKKSAEQSFAWSRPALAADPNKGSEGNTAFLDKLKKISGKTSQDAPGGKTGWFSFFKKDAPSAKTVSDDERKRVIEQLKGGTDISGKDAKAHKTNKGIFHDIFSFSNSRPGTSKGADDIFKKYDPSVSGQAANQITAETVNQPNSALADKNKLSWWSGLVSLGIRKGIWTRRTDADPGEQKVDYLKKVDRNVRKTASNISKGEPLIKLESPDLLNGQIGSDRSIPDPNAGVALNDNRWENPMVIETNLIKGENLIFTSYKKAVLAILVSLFLLAAAITASFLYLNYLIQKEDIIYNNIKIQNENMVKKIKEKELKMNETLDMQKNISYARFLLDRHIYWSNLFVWLEKSTIPEVSYSSFDGTISGDFIIPAQAKSFYAVSQQVAAVSGQKWVREAAVNKVSFRTNPQDGDFIEFNIMLKLDPDIFLK